MKIIVADSAGFCFGVNRAVSMTEDALAEGSCCSLGELIHNRDVVDDLASRGLTVAQTAADVPEGARVVLRSHGVSRQEKQILESKRCRMIDATCPKVARIHKIAQQTEKEGGTLVVFGEPDHPEVQGICGWCGNSVVVQDEKSFRDWMQRAGISADAPLTVVFQTTSNTENSKQIINSLKKLCTKTKFFDTICNATSIRQKQARELADSCDAMVVVGGVHSANSIHLAEICSQECGNVFFIQNAGELDVSALRHFDKIGVTAGASTPSWIIKEVVNKMSETEIVTEAVEEQAAEMTFEQMVDDSMRSIHNGDVVTGTVAAIGATEITLDLEGTKHTAYIATEEFTSANPGVAIEDLVKIGDTIEASVVRVNDVEGTAQLSKSRLDRARSWDEIQEAADARTILEGKVTEDNKGGVVINLKGIRVFIPASQTGLAKSEPMSTLVGQTVRFRITEVDRGRKQRVVGSIRAILQEERREKREKIWSEIEVGKVYQGVVKSMTSYGAFVDIGGVDGMVHVSEISWKRIRKPEDVLSIGQEVEVYVLSFDTEKHKISLGYRKAEDNPWMQFTSKYAEGDVATVKIVKFMAFGAFAEIVPGVDGLIHISQIADHRINKPEDELTVGQEVQAKITAIDNDKQKVSLSIRALIEKPAPVAEEPEEEYEAAPVDDGSDALVYEISATGEATGFAPEEDETEE